MQFTLLNYVTNLRALRASIGRTTGPLMSAIRQQALSELKRNWVLRCKNLLTGMNVVLQRMFEEDSYDVSNCTHSIESRRDGKWLPFDFIEASLLTNSLSLFSQKRRMQR